MLVLDAFRGHLPEEVEVKLKRKNYSWLIPDGKTSQFQLLDVSVNKPFKDYLRQEYEACLRYENLPLTPSGKTKRASALKLAEWVSDRLEDLAKTVEQSFKKCCITNALYGTEDDI
jgi:hypothetical protein